MDNTNAIDVFISYSSVDEEAAERLKQALEAAPRNLRVWKANCVSISTGEYFKEKIIDAIERAKIILFVFSKHSLSSNWVAMELNVAIFENKKIFPVVIDDAPLSEAYRFKLGCSQFLDARKDFASAVEMIAVSAKMAYDATIERERRELRRHIELRHYPYPVVLWLCRGLLLCLFASLTAMIALSIASQLGPLELLSLPADDPFATPFLASGVIFLVSLFLLIPFFIVRSVMFRSLKNLALASSPSALYEFYRAESSPILFPRRRIEAAFAALERSADLGYLKAIKRIIRMYDRGTWGKKNPEKAAHYRRIIDEE